MDNVIVRQATQEDVAVLLTFEQGIIKAERPYDETLKPDPISYYSIIDLVANPDAEVLVAEVDGTIVGSGFAIIKEGKPYCKHTDYAYLGFMYTDPEYRGMGINSKIIAGLKDWAFARDLHEVRLTVYDDNAGAIKAYEKVGFKKHIAEMRLVK